jgi:UDP-glucose 4-epimerase
VRILVTGASGFVGKYVIEELEQGHELRLFSRRHPKEGREGLDTRHPFVQGDLNDAEAVRRAVEGVDAVAHVGANPWFSPVTFATNAVVRRVVVAGSDWGVGKCAERPEPPVYVPVDSAHPCRPRDPYGLSKVVTETVAELYGREYGIASAVLRITGVWRPDATAGYAAKDRSGAARECAQYWWTYVDVRDVARAFRAALEAPSLPAFGAYFVAAADSLLDEPTADAVRVHWPSVEVRRPLRGHETVLDISEAERAFGWRPVHSWRSGG